MRIEFLSKTYDVKNMSESESLVCPNCSERSPGGYILCPYCGFDLTKIVRARERVRVNFRERFSRIWRSLFDPRQSQRLFREIGVNPDRTGALLVLFLLSVAYGLRLGALVLKTGFDTGASWHDLHFWFLLISPWFLAIGFVILALFGWFISSCVVWFIATRLGGKASFRDTQGIVGYSFGPLITASLIINLILASQALIPILGINLSSITPTTVDQLVILELINIPFMGLVAYHCGNGIRSAHLLNNYFSYGISGGVTLLYFAIFFLPVIF